MLSRTVLSARSTPYAASAPAKEAVAVGESKLKRCTFLNSASYDWPPMPHAHFTPFLVAFQHPNPVHPLQQGWTRAFL